MPEQNSIERIRGNFATEIKASSSQLNLRDGLLHAVTQPKVLRPLISLGVVAGAFAPGVIEGSAMGMPLDQAIIYGIGDTFLSVTRTTYDLNELAQAFFRGNGQEIDEAARKAIPHYTTEIQGIITASVIAAGAVGSWQSFRRHSEDRQKAILEGQAKIKRPSEQMFLFGGEESQVANVLSAILGDQALPIFETSNAAESILNRAARGKSLFPIDKKGNPQTPVYLNLGVDGPIGYQNSLGWNKLTLRASNFLKTGDGRQLLVTYGFGETNREALPLKDEVEQDLTVSELLAGTNQLELLAKRKGIKIDQIVKVYLGNARLRRQRYTGRGIQEFSDREAAKGIDIFIDTRAPIVDAIVKLIGEGKGVAFETSRVDYADELRKAASCFDVQVFGKENPVENSAGVTAVVHEENVSDTLELASDLQNQRTYGHVVALTPTLWAHERAVEKGLESLCVPLIYAELMLETRCRLRRGETPATIQEDFDRRFPYLPVA